LQDVNVKTSQALIREPRSRDEAAMLSLLAELGYPASSEVLGKRLRRLQDDPGTEVFVAEVGGEVVGLAVLHVTPLLERPPLGRITAIVVSGWLRRQGVGRVLIDHVEEHARRAGCDRLELTTSEHRTEAHAFYRRLGFAERSRRFVKTLV
jgi:ribosomal protein S18 acetylase RimI-like enzyme